MDVKKNILKDMLGTIQALNDTIKALGMRDDLSPEDEALLQEFSYQVIYLKNRLKNHLEAMGAASETWV